MTQKNRDLWVVFRKGLLSNDAFNREVGRINTLLLHTERLENFVKSHEMINLHKHKVIRSNLELKNYIRNKKANPFIFIYNCN